MPGICISQTVFKEVESYYKYSCSYCKLLINSPVQIECGHLICKSCADEILRLAQSTPTCPECGNYFTEEDGTYYFLDHVARREIMSLDVFCPYREIGCDWEGKFEQYDAHVYMCRCSRELKPFAYNIELEQGDLVVCNSNEPVAQKFPMLAGLEIPEMEPFPLTGFSCKTFNVQFEDLQGVEREHLAMVSVQVMSLEDRQTRIGRESNHLDRECEIVQPSSLSTRSRSNHTPG